MIRKPDFLKSEFFKNISYQVIGTALSQLILFGATPILTRIYTESEFALFTSFFALATILTVGVGGRYQFAIVLPEKDEEAIHIFTLSNYITIVYSIALTILALATGFFAPDWLGVTVYFIPIYVLVFGIWTSFSYLSVRHKTFLHNATAKVLQSIAYVGVSVGLGVSKVTGLGLVLGRVIGSVASWGYLYRKSSIRMSWGNPVQLKAVAIKYIAYPKYGLIPAFLDVASVQGIILILTKFYSHDELGYFGLTSLVLSVPLAFVSSSFRDVFYREIASLITRGEVKRAQRVFLKSAVGLLIIGLPICLIIQFWGVDIFKIVFGERWARAGEFASLVSVCYLVQLVVSPLSAVFNATHRIKIASFWQLFYFISTFLTLGICAAILKLDVEKLLLVYVIHDCVLYSIYFFLQYKVIKNYK